MPGAAAAPPIELEVKAVVPDPGAVLAALASAGAAPGFRGLMEDRRLDRAGELARRDEVLRLRTFHHPGGRRETKVSWKGPVSVTSGGYKRRAELEYRIDSPESEPEALFLALGFTEVHRIDRQVAYLSLAGAAVRLEWYPRMDVLLEVEGQPAAIEAAITATGLPREAFSADALTDFTIRYAARTGRPAVLSIRELGSDPPQLGRRIVTAPIRLPELGPFLGHLVDPPGRFQPSDLGLDDVRLALVTDLFERAQVARGFLLTGDTEGALSALGRTTWLELWRGAVDRVADRTIAAIEARLRAAAKASAMPRRRLARLLPNAEDRAVLHAQLDAAGIPLEELTDRLAQARAEEWVEIVRRAAGALQTAWETVEQVVRRSLADWNPVFRAAETWRPPTLVRWVPVALLAVLAAWLGLGFGGYLPLPGFLAPLAAWFWSLPWP